jgi:peptidoglycan L-alanyl-D-glutamate endopeptidase CwlK
MSDLKNILTASDAFYKEVLSAGYSIPGYSRMSSASTDLQKISYMILGKYRGWPFGTVIPFKYKGIEYAALVEEHGPGARNPNPHPGISLFIKPTANLNGISKRSANIISGLDPRFQPYVVELLRRGIAAGLRPELVEGTRSQDRQDELYEQGRTKPGNVVTWTRKSKHSKGMAVDLTQLDDKGHVTYNVTPGFYDHMGQIGKQLGLVWGGNFPTPDVGHFQL